MIREILFISSLLYSCFYSQVLYADWPRHRGDAALNGYSKAQVGNSLELKWSYDTGDYLKSSVVVENGVAYVGSEVGVLHAISLETGKKKWTYKTGMAIEAPPLLHNNRVIVGSTDSFLYSINQKTGKLQWKRRTCLQTRLCFFQFSENDNFLQICK